MPDYSIVHASPAQADICLDGLAELLRDSVHNGASIGFHAPLAPEIAREYWQSTFSDIADRELALLVALDRAGTVAGSVQLARCPKDNGRHRAEIRKLMVHSDHRRQGLATLLMAQLETLAREWGLSLLVLDTAEGEPAELLYQGMNYIQAGVIPGYADYPDGSLTGTVFYYKQFSNIT